MPFQLLAPRDPQDRANLVKASLEEWNLTFDHPLSGHTDPQPDVKATWGARIHPPT